MIRVLAFSAILLISGLIAATPSAAQSNGRLAAPQSAAGSAQGAERTIVCNRLHCWTIREGCRFVAAPHFRDSRIRCGPTRPA